MTCFDSMSIEDAAAEFELLGAVVDYHHNTGITSGIHAVINRSLSGQPGGYGSNRAAPIIDCSLLVADAPNVRRGDLVVDEAGRRYRVDQVGDNDGVVVSFTVQADE